MARATPDLTEVLTRIATPVAASTRTSSKSKFPRSRFIFQVDDEAISKLKESVKQAEVVVANKEDLERVEVLKKTLIPAMDENANRVRDFILDDLAPLTLALNAGVSKAVKAIKDTTGLDVEPSTVQRFSKMAHYGVHLKLALYLEDFLSLPKGSSEYMLAEPQRTNKALQNPNTEPRSSEESSGITRERKLLRRVLEQQLSSSAIPGVKHGPVEG